MNEGLKLNNKGLSLIELLVALAISSIILAAVTLLMSNGVFGYNKQTTMSTLQDDANLTMNHVINAIMEANYIDLVQTEDGANTYTFVTHNGSTDSGIASNKYIFDAATQTVYVADIGDDLDEASPLCTRVKKFLVQITEDSFNFSNNLESGTIASVSDVVQFKVTIVLESNSTQREVIRYTNVRNKLDLDTLKLSSLLSEGVSDIKGLVRSDLKNSGYIAD